MLRVAMLSKWHVHAEGYARALMQMEDVKITCVWDEDAARGQAWAESLHVDFEEDLDTLLARGDVDAVAIDSPTNMHPALMLRAAQARKHIFTEKVMALTVAECDAIIDAVRKAGVKFTISFPHRCQPLNLYLKQCVEDGLIGDVTVMRCRNVHAGALANWLPDYWYDPVTTGGGAMMDLGAHPMYLARWICGTPKRIQATFNSLTNRAVDDNAVATIEFTNGAIAIAETSLVSPLAAYSMEVYGTKGAILVRDNEVRIRSSAMSDAFHGWLIPDRLPQALKPPIRQFVESCLYDAPIHFGLEEGRQLTELMEHAYRAHREMRSVSFGA